MRFSWFSFGDALAFLSGGRVGTDSYDDAVASRIHKISTYEVPNMTGAIGRLGILSTPLCVFLGRIFDVQDDGGSRFVAAVCGCRGSRVDDIARKAMPGAQDLFTTFTSSLCLCFSAGVALMIKGGSRENKKGQL